MKRMLLLWLCCLILQVPGWAQDDDKPTVPPELMEPGAYATTVQGWLKANSVRVYSLTAEKGQSFTAQLITKDDSGSLRFFLPDGKDSLPEVFRDRRVDSFDFQLSETGRYTLEIRSHDTACSYLLEVSILDAPPSPAPSPDVPRSRGPNPDELRSPATSPERFKNGCPPESRPESFPSEPEERPSIDGL